MALYIDGKEVETFTKYYRPRHEMTKSALKTHGITMEYLEKIKAGHFEEQGAQAASKASIAEADATAGTEARDSEGSTRRGRSG